MMVYKITTPAGRSYTAELNPAGAVLEVQRGNTVTVVGLSPIAIRVNAVRTAAELLAREDITDDQYDAATSLMRQHGITADELNALQFCA
jgi:hypothetical protein